MEQSGKLRSLTRRVEFTDVQKAEIYARDRATCCFSGANLWLLDSPLRPGYQRDWVDHILPSARGGKTEPVNGVCASHAFNAKKRHNSADTAYLFRSGEPTRLHYEIFGVPSDSTSARFKRLRHLLPADWYFNRALGRVLLAFDYRVGVDCYDEAAPKRDDKFWFRAAYKMLGEYQRLNPKRIEDRSLIEGGASQIQSAWLGLREVRCEEELQDAVSGLYADYYRNAVLWLEFFEDADSRSERSAVIRRLTRSRVTNSDVEECIRDAYCRSGSELGLDGNGM